MVPHQVKVKLMKLDQVRLEIKYLVKFSFICFVSVHTIVYIVLFVIHYRIQHRLQDANCQ